MHPTQHTTHKRPMPRILRTHQLITQGVSPETADAFVKTAASNLQALSKAAAAKQPPLHIAPVRPNLPELLSRASQQAKPFIPRNRNLNPNNAA